MGLDTMLSALGVRIAGLNIDFWWGCSLSPGARASWVGKIGAGCLEQQLPERPNVPFKQEIS